MKLEYISSISKPKIPANYAYVLRSSQLNSLLERNAFQIHTDLRFYLPQQLGSILMVHYWLPNQNVPYRRLYIQSGAVLQQDAKTANQLLMSEAFPRLEVWLRDLLHQPENATIFSRKLDFYVVYHDRSIYTYISNENK